MGKKKKAHHTPRPLLILGVNPYSASVFFSIYSRLLPNVNICLKFHGIKKMGPITKSKAGYYCRY